MLMYFEIYPPSLFNAIVTGSWSIVPLLSYYTEWKRKKKKKHNHFFYFLYLNVRARRNWLYSVMVSVGSW